MTFQYRLGPLADETTKNVNQNFWLFMLNINFSILQNISLKIVLMKINLKFTNFWTFPI